MKAESYETPLTCAANEGGRMKRNEGGTLLPEKRQRFFSRQGGIRMTDCGKMTE
jgi:hypothetical protein